MLYSIWFDHFYRGEMFKNLIFIMKGFLGSITMSGLFYFIADGSNYPVGDAIAGFVTNIIIVYIHKLAKDGETEK